MRYRNKAYLDEINDDNTDEEHVISEQVDLPVQNAEEESWKKRYGDLRRKAQADATTLEGRLKALENQLAEATQDTMELPKTEAQVADWMAEYPEVAGLIKTMIMMEAGKTRDEIKQLKERNALDKHELELEKALNELLKAHPDFLDIRSTVEFTDWTQDQPKWVNKALYDEDEIDTQGAIRAIDLYKLDVAKTSNKAAPAPTRDDERRRDATSVRTPRTQSPNEGGAKVWHESELEKLSRKEWDRYEDEIEAARRAGKIVYDISAGAR